MDDREDLVSIIIPVFNRASLLNETINSILKQTYENWELILVDDGSTDKSPEIMLAAAKQDLRIKVYNRPRNKLRGGNAARNFGFEKSAGDFVNWFDSDDVMHPDFIQKKIKGFKLNTELDLIFSRTIRTNFKDQTIPDERLKESDKLLENYIIREVSWYLPDAMLKRSYLTGKDLFDENLLAGQDRDFYIRLFAQEFPKIKILDFYGTFYRIHTSSISEKLYRDGNLEMQLSHYKSLLNQVEVLQQNGEFSQKLRIHYLKELKKRLPAIVKTNTSVRSYFKQIWKFSSLNKTTLKVWGQIIPAYLSFAAFGKGERFLK